MSPDVVESCIKNIRGVVASSQFNTVCECFQSFITTFKEVLLIFESNEFSHKDCSPQVQDRVCLCFSQLRKSLLMMISLMKASLTFGFVSAESKTFICQRIILCLDQLREMSKKVSISERGVGRIPEVDNEEEDLSGGLFIVCMDQALSLLAVFEAGLNEGCAEKNMSLSQWRIIVDNLLGHALTIAQVTSSLDFKDIHCSCEKILREFESLRKEYEKDTKNVSECRLYTVSLTAALEKLEQRVCSAVLKMHLLVFSDCGAPLRALVRACWRETAAEETRKGDDIENLICAFDAHMDRLIQVALFAIACSTSQSLVRCIRSCLASLESMEPHLVPALQALYLRKSDRRELEQFVRFLTEHWIDEVEALSGFINLIVDPAALAQVTYDEARLPAASLKKAISSGKSVSASECRKLVAAVMSPVSALMQQLNTVGKSPDIKPSSALVLTIDDIRKGLQHLKESEGLADSDPVDLSKRCLKRCEVVVTCVKKVIPLLEEAFIVEPKAALPPLPLISPDGVRDLPHDVSSHLDTLASIPQVESKLPVAKEPSKVAEMSLQSGRWQQSSLRSTSILYKEKRTPKIQSTGSKLLRSVLMENARRSGLKRRTSVFNRTSEVENDSSQTSVMQETLGLTALLDGLSSLSASPEAEPEAETIPRKANERRRESIPAQLDDECESCVEISVDSGRSNSICTPQRLKDLADLRRRIDALRKAHDLP